MRKRLPIPSIFARLADDRGQTLVVAALCMVVLIGFMGLAIDIGNLRYQKRALQSVADAAALAAAIEVRICGTTSNCLSMQQAAQQAVAENGYAVTTTLTNCSGTAGSGFTLTVNNPPCSLSADPNIGKLNYAEAIVTENVPTYFARILGINTLPISARAEAARGVGGPCIYALDPAGPSAITITGAVGLNFPCGIVDESSASNALSCIGGIAINAPSINVTGGVSGFLCSSSPPPHTGVAVPQPADPLAYLPAPALASAACGTTNGSPYTGSPSQVVILGAIASTTVFHPGVYCGGISITAGLLTNITFTPGTYVLRQGPGPLGLGTTGGLSINITALSTITGNGVLFYNQGATGGLSIGAASLLGLSNVSFSAATSGEYGGVLFFQAHGVTALGNFSNLLSGSLFTGAIYLPDAPLDYDLNAVSGSYNILVAKDITFTGAILSGFGNNYATLQSGSPLNGDNVELVQ